jgi:hypothetical protein
MGEMEFAIIDFLARIERLGRMKADLRNLFCSDPVSSVQFVQSVLKKTLPP